MWHIPTPDMSMSHMNESNHVTRINESCNTYEWFTMRHIPIRDMSMSHICMSRLMWHIWMSPVTHMNESSHTYEWVKCDTFLYETWVCHAYEWVISYQIYEWVMWHIWMSHVTHMNESCDIYEWVMSHVWTSHVTHMNESSHTYEWVDSDTHNSHAHVYERIHFTQISAPKTKRDVTSHMHVSRHTCEYGTCSVSCHT